MLQFLKRIFRVRTERERINDYLAESVDLVDLEIRMRRIDRGEAPWQVKINDNLRGWV